MRQRNIFTRFHTFYQKHGFIRSFYRLYEQPYRMLKRQEVLFYVDMDEVSDVPPNLPLNVTIEVRKSYNEADRPDMQKMVHYWNEEHLTARVKERFEMGAILWLLKVDGNIAGFIWSIRGKFVAPYFIPLTPRDAVFIDAVFFEEYRGHGYLAILLNYVLWQLKKSGVHRTFAHIYEWNKSSLHGIEKTQFRRFAKARQFNLLGRNVVVFSEP